MCLQDITPLDTPPSCLTLKKKSAPIFLGLEIESMIAKTNFMLGPIEILDAIASPSITIAGR